MKLEKKFVIKMILEIVVIAAVVLGLFFGITTNRIKINPIFVPGTAIKGTVIGEEQGNPDLYDLLYQGVYFICFSATRGTDTTGDSFGSQWKTATEMGVAKSAIHEFTFEDKGKDQAKKYIKTVGSFRNGDLFPVVEVKLYDDYIKSPPFKDEVDEELGDLLKQLEKEYSVKPILRATPEIFKKYLDEGYEDYSRWVVCEDIPIYFKMGVDWALWQYDGKKEYAGTDGFDHTMNLSYLSWRVRIDEIRFTGLNEPSVEEEPANEQ